MGFSQGAILSAALPGLQARGVALTRVPKVKYVVIIGGAKFQSPAVAEKAYATKIECPSLHFIGDADFLKQHGETLLESFVDPYVIRHPKGHTVPRIDDASMETMLNFLNKIENDLNDFVEDATTFEQEEVA
uniref:Serine hydrolase domain-containing protein n=1 Tax=Ananas comosus var. bracteatus TaxID=296719 RepID=A0A6V7P811_ANACO|nr:unnamed protein product [Ananas comosus var. bracteatus]